MNYKVIGLLACVIGFIIFMIGEAFFFEYASGVNSSTTNQQGSEAGMYIGGITYFVGVIMYSIAAKNMTFLIINIIVLGIVLLQVAEYYGLGNKTNNQTTQQEVYAALGIGLILLAIASSMYVVGTSETGRKYVPALYAKGTSIDTHLANAGKALDALQGVSAAT